ncbi:DUF1289 domain-containing protein [Rheinheimera tilapiae]|jgi:uncharacterized protein|uniref:DUF1289 domain-containing protein n=1 Tax=Rheinheimera tilapiae TaxID=875043 RepID=A0ABV6B9L2_9GAMM
MTEQPCVRNCCLDPADVCLGCGRTLPEITGWHQANELEKQQILQRSQQRLQQMADSQLRRRAANRPE